MKKTPYEQLKEYKQRNTPITVYFPAKDMPRVREHAKKNKKALGAHIRETYLAQIEQN